MIAMERSTVAEDDDEVAAARGGGSPGGPAAVGRLLAVIGVASGRELWAALASGLCELLGARLALVSEVVEVEPLRLRALALTRDGVERPGVAIDPARSPCALVVGGTRMHLTEDALEAFPDSWFGKLVEVSGYLGMPLFDARGRVLGHVAVLSSGPLEIPETLLPALDWLVERAAAELEHRRTAREVIASDHLSELVFEASHDGMVLLDPAGRVLRTNPRAQQMLGWSAAELIGRTLEELEAGADAYLLRQALERVRSEGSARFQMSLRQAGGGLVRAEISASRVDAGDASAELLVMRDVSDRGELEEQLIRAQRMEAIGRLAGGIAHDFNNLLTLIEGHCKLLQDRVPGDPEIRAEVDLIREAGRRASELTRGLLAFSRQQVLKTEVLDLNELAVELARILDPMLGERIELELDLAPDLWPVRADRSRIEQVLINLAVNAQDAMADGGTLSIRSENFVASDKDPERPPIMLSGDYVRVTVADTGRGIAADVLPKIFEPFFTTKDVGHGTGLGLATSYGVVKQSGGFIFVDSEVGRGSAFSVYLPRAAATLAARPGDEPQMPLAAAPATVLVVEDHEQIRALMTRLLEGMGFSILTAGTGDEALAILRRDPTVELVLTDVVMPGIGIRKLVAELRRLRSDLPVILMSGYSSEIIRRPIHNESFLFLEKPFSAERLCEAVHQALERRTPPSDD